MRSTKRALKNASYRKRLDDGPAIQHGTPRQDVTPAVPNSSLRSIVERSFRRMNETHDRIRTSLLASNGHGVG